MFTSPLKYRKCTYAAHCPLQSPQVPTGNEMSKNPDVRYICEVDERLGLFVRLYAIVESSVQKISAEMLIEQIRAEILPFDRTYGEHPVNNIGNDAQLAGHINTILASFERLHSQVRREQKEGTANIAIIIIRGHLILCGILGDMVFTLLRKNADCNASRVGSQQYTLFSNCYKPQTLKGSNLAATNSLVNLYVHQIQPSDLRFFVFTRESVRMLLQSFPSMTLFTKSSEEIIWSLHLWQTEMYAKDPYKVPAAGFILVDNLSKLIEDGSIRLDENFSTNLFQSSEKAGKEQLEAKELKREQGRKRLENKLAAQSNTIEKSGNATNRYSIFLETELKKIQTKYNGIKEFIDKLLHQEKDEMLAYLKREEEILNLEKECEKQTERKSKVLNLQQQQRKQLAELQIFLRKVLKYQDFVGCELLINIEKLEQKIEVAILGADEIHLRMVYQHYQRMRNVSLFQTKIEQNLENSQQQLQEVVKNSFKIQWKLDTLKVQIQRNKQLAEPSQGTRPMPGQDYFKGAGAHHATNNYHDNEFSKRCWSRRPNSAVFWQNSCYRNQ